jgi:hypothetical protein
MGKCGGSLRQINLFESLAAKSPVSRYLIDYTASTFYEDGSQFNAKRYAF